MAQIKIAFFDIDGTMIDMQKKNISGRMVQTLHQLQQNGIRICVATGRAPMTLPCFQDVTFDLWLTFNGSLCYDSRRTLIRNPLLPSDVHTIIANARSINRPVSLATASRLAANGADQDLIDYYAISKQRVEIAEDFDEVACQDVYQIMMGCRKEEYARIMKDVQNAKIAAWWDRAADIIPANGGKGIAVTALLRQLGLRREEALAFGDGENDIDMLQAVGHGVAMGNASQAVKQAAEECCGPVEEEGITEYCLRHHLI